MRRILAVLAAASLVLVIAVPPAAATTTRHEITCEEHLVATLAPPKEWIDEEGVYHVRGLVLEVWRSSERLDDGGLTTWGTARVVATDGAIWAGPFVGARQPQLDPGETITRAWLVREDGGSGEVILREQGPPTGRVIEAEIRP